MESIIFQFSHWLAAPKPTPYPANPEFPTTEFIGCSQSSIFQPQLFFAFFVWSVSLKIYLSAMKKHNYTLCMRFCWGLICFSLELGLWQPLLGVGGSSCWPLHPHWVPGVLVDPSPRNILFISAQVWWLWLVWGANLPGCPNLSPSPGLTCSLPR